MNWYKKAQSTQTKEIQPLLNELQQIYTGLAISAQEYDNHIILFNIKLPKAERRQGKGSEIIKIIQNYADNKNKFILLHPTTNLSFYSQLGFTKVPSEKRYDPDSPLFSPANEFWYWSNNELV